MSWKGLKVNSSFKNIGNLTFREKILIFVVIALTISGLFLHNFITPLYGKNESFRAKKEMMMVENLKLEDEINYLKREKEFFPSDYKEYETILPGEKKLEKTLLNLEKMMAQREVKISRINLGTTRKWGDGMETIGNSVAGSISDYETTIQEQGETGLKSFDISIEVQGELEDIYELIIDIEEFYRVITIDSISLNGALEVPQKEIEAKLGISLYWDGLFYND